MRRIARFTVTTGPDYGSSGDDCYGAYPTVTFGAADMRFIAASDGVSWSDNNNIWWHCVPAGQEFPQYEPWQPSTTYSGGIEIIVSEESGTLVLGPSWMIGGWEWQIL